MAGNSLRRARSPVAPKMVRTHGCTVRETGPEPMLMMRHPSSSQ
jgi:hypothetical protein